ncbi:MAG TPA: hypothetical protein VNS22_01610 [Geminicoccus sp.]|uniref:anti-sigma factor family protein n=1 Tax=Geminicoccus sp. TaxID=2024832 RepID=UPI002C31C53F|nr:hypothetical protein [Geminicoccus sp.]HWL67059.1 hypothetical protein [Geminicoccus sp.]
MDCASLERYLEAYLEGRLRRAQWLVLRRHVMTCQHCRHRVEELRRFEVDLHQRFRAMARTQRLWTGLELDLVGLPSAAASGDTLPPKSPRPSISPLSGALLLPPARTSRATALPPQETAPREQRWSMVALVCLVLAGAGTGGWFLVRPGSDPGGEVASSLRLLDGGHTDAPAEDGALAMPIGAAMPDETSPVAAGGVDLDHVEVGPDQLQGWLDRQLGRPIDLPLPVKAEIVGGSDVPMGNERRPAVLIDTPQDGRLMILPTPDGMTSMSAEVAGLARERGFSHLVRRYDGVTLDVLGDVSAARLDELFFIPASLN